MRLKFLIRMKRRKRFLTYHPQRRRLKHILRNKLIYLRNKVKKHWKNFFWAKREPSNKSRKNTPKSWKIMQHNLKLNTKKKFLSIRLRLWRYNKRTTRQWKSRPSSWRNKQQGSRRLSMRQLNSSLKKRYKSSW